MSDRPETRPGRFYKLDAVATARRDITSSDKVLLAVIVDAIGNNGLAWPGTRRLASLTGTDRKTVLDSIRRLENAGLIEVVRHGNGRQNHYLIPTASGGGSGPVEDSGRSKTPTGSSGGETGPATESDRFASATAGGGETGPKPGRFSDHNQTDQSKDQRAGNAPLTSHGDTKGKSNGVGRLVAEWAEGAKTRGVAFSNRGKVAGVLKRLIEGGQGVEKVGQAIRTWWSDVNRPDFGIELFFSRLQGGNAELTGRRRRSNGASTSETYEGVGRRYA